MKRLQTAMENLKYFYSYQAEFHVFQPKYDTLKYDLELKYLPSFKLLRKIHLKFIQYHI